MRRSERHRGRLGALLACGVAVLAGSCGGDSPTTPTPPPTPVQNAPPVIKSLTATPTRVEVSTSRCAGTSACPTRATLTATVEDAETPPAQLSYEWSATGVAGVQLGTFEGSGATVAWVAPSAIAAAQTVDIRVTVVEKYASQVGGAIDREHRVSATTGIRVHDSVTEVGDLATQFLTEFSTSSIQDPQFLVRNFSDSCPGKAAELSDVTKERANYWILGSSLGPPAVTITFTPSPCGSLTRPEGDGCAQLSCRWTSQCLATADPRVCTPGRVYNPTGTCVLSAIYERERWWLCDSRFYQVGASVGTAVR